MAQALNSLPRPGVQVIQQFRAQTPTVITPTLVPNVVGVCKQIVELLVSDGAGGQVLNTNAVISMPAFFVAKEGTGSPKRYFGLNGKKLVLSIKNSPDVTVTFSDAAGGGLLPSSMVSQVNTAFRTQRMTAALAKAVGTTQWMLQTVGVGTFETIKVQSTTDADVASALGIGIGKTYYGLSNYNQRDVTVPPISFPDPRGNLSELSFEQDSLRLWLSLGSGTDVREALRDEALLRYGAPGEAAFLVSDDDIRDGVVTYPGDVQGKTLFLKVDSGDEQAVIISSSPATAGAFVAELDALIRGADVDIIIGGVDQGKMRITSQKLGASSKIELTGGTLLEVVGLTFSTTSAVSTEGTVDLTGAYPGATAIQGTTLKITIDQTAAQSITFPGALANAANLLSFLNGVGGVVGATATQGTGGGLVFTSDSTGSNSIVSITGGTSLSVLGLVVETVTGTGAIDTGTGISADDDGNGDAVTSLIRFPGEDFTATATKATLETVAAVGLPTDGNTLVLSDGGQPQTITFLNALADTDVVDQVNAVMAPAAGGKITADLDTGKLRLTHSEYGEDGLIEIVGGTAVAELDVGTAAITIAGIVDMTGLTLPGDVVGLTIQVAVDGGAIQTVLFTSGATSVANLLGEVNAQTTGLTASGTQYLVMTSATTGHNSSIRIVGGTALPVLGLFEHTAHGASNMYIGAVAVGNSHKPLPGDVLYIDGTQYGIINNVAVGGDAELLRIDRTVTISTSVGARFWIQAKMLDIDVDQPIDRPFPELILDLNNNLLLKDGIVRDAVSGERVVINSPLYMSYSAIRKDVTALAADPGLLKFDDTIQLEDALEPISTANPLGLGLFFALINAPGIQVTGLGVDEVTADMPDGTVEAYTRAAEYLEGQEVYSIALLTKDSSVAQVFSTHVSFMSEPTQRGERIVLWNTDIPSRGVDTLVASGTEGEATTTYEFKTGVGNLSALLQNAGIDPTGTIQVSDGVFLDISVDSNKYSVSAVNGQVITLRVSAAEFQSGENDDDFYAESDLPLPLVGELFSIRIRGKELVTVNGTADRNAQAEAINLTGQAFKNRRFWMTFPGQARATIQGVEQLIEGYYMNAATVGLIGQQTPQQSFTNFPVAGFTGVVGSNDTFSEAQLDLMAGGGAYIFIQEGAGTPIFARQAVTTDQTSIETRTDSVTKVVDFTAKFMRKSLRNFIGRFNITQGFLDSLGTTVQGVFGFLVETGVLIGGTLDNVIQDENNRDTVLIDTTLDVPIPCNYIKLTLLI